MLLKCLKSKKKRKIEQDIQRPGVTALPINVALIKKETKEVPIQKKAKKSISSANDVETKDVDVMETEDYADSDEDCAAKPCKQPTGLSLNSI